MLRKMISNYLLEKTRGDPVGILFSGGMDSLSVLISCLDVGIPVSVYSFKLDGVESTDIIRCREIVSVLGIPYKEITIPNDVKTLEKDVRHIIGKFKVFKKTIVQCIHPFLYVFPIIKEKYVATGLCADDLYGTPKSMAMRSKDNVWFKNERLKKLEDPTSSAYQYIKLLADENGKNLLAPYKDYEPLTSYMLSLSFKDMHSGKQKRIMYEDYSDVLDKYKWYRRNENLQCSSKLREHHDELLLTSLNNRNLKGVVGIYGDIYREYFEK